MAEDERQAAAPEMPRGAPSGDLEYDEAHDAVASATASRPREHRPVQVATETDDGGGDYAYDLAHDVPRGSGTSGSGTR